MYRILFVMALCVASIPSHAQDIEIVMERVGQTCTASHYGHKDGYNGRRTANGEIFNTYRDMTAAMLKKPFNSYVTVTNLKNGKSVKVRINDRGPFIKGRCIDLSYLAAQRLGMDGIAPVSVE
jgi:rare lipoprotein A